MYISIYEDERNNMNRQRNENEQLVSGGDLKFLFKFDTQQPLKSKKRNLNKNKWPFFSRELSKWWHATQNYFKVSDNRTSALIQCDFQNAFGNISSTYTGL